MPSYTEEDGRALTKPELLRLLVLADGYKMVWCMEECARALLPFAGYGDALAYFLHVPDSLLQMKPLQVATKAAGDALAAPLRPVEALWRPGSGQAFNGRYPLDELVVALLIGGIEALLRSEQL